MATEQRFILLPARGLRAGGQAGPRQSARAFLLRASAARPVAVGGKRRGEPPAQLRVIDSIREDGAKLVEASPDVARTLRVVQPGLRLVPVVYYEPAVSPRPQVASQPGAAGVRRAAAISVKVTSRATGQPLAGAEVVAFTDFAARAGAQGVTGADGTVSLALGGTSARVQRVYVWPATGHWSLLRKNVTLRSGTSLTVAPIELGTPDLLRQTYPGGEARAGRSVRVAVVDCGVGPHPDLRVAGGENTVVGEPPGSYLHNGSPHGTHVAGIIAARGKPPSGLRGLAPAVKLMSYRVFGEGAERASNYAIAKAIDRAIAAKCDLINLSLGGGSPDPAVEAAIDDARAAGSVVIAAAGNEDRSAVSFPGRLPAAVAVSAMGRKGTFPADAGETAEVSRPYGKPDKDSFIASFSNIGPEIDLTGTGVGVVSTVPGGYVAMSGTSMACPAVTGVAARLLSANNEIRAMKRDEQRADAIIRLLLSSATPLGFGQDYEGQGLPR